MSHSSLASLLDVDLQPGKPPVVRAEAGGDAAGWAARYREPLRAVVAERGCVLVRGLGLRNATEAGAVFRGLAAGLMTEREAFAPRQPYPGGVYSVTPWPPNQQMCMHHELSYALEFPGLVMFACLTAPAAGGATGVADAPAVLSALPAALVQRFEQQGWVLTRNYNEDIGASVEQAFGTGDRHAVESYCRANAIEFAWQPGGGLRTRQRRSAVVRHPVTGQRCWFNQIAFLNERTIDPEVREYLVEVYGQDGLPFTTFFGNGDPVGADVVDLLNADLRGAHRPRALAARRPAAGGQHPHRAQPGTLRRAARGARRAGRPGAPGRLLPGHRGDRPMSAPAALAVPPFAVIPGGQVQQALAGRERQVAELVEATYRLHGAGDSVNPPSYFLRFPDRPSDRIIALPASIGGPHRVDGLKWISSFPGNVAAGIPRASAVLILNDHDTGYPFACLESSIISATRTAASAAVAADWLSRGRPRPAAVGFIGTGLIARYIHTFLAGTGWSFDQIGVHDLSAASAAGFRGYLDHAGGTGPITLYDDPGPLIRSSDLVIFATIAGKPHISDPPGSRTTRWSCTSRCATSPRRSCSPR